MSDSSTVGPGTVLGERYELADIIGRGGFGTVWRARQLNMDRDVAVKVLPAQFMSLKDVVERFKREARLASRLRHPNTITLHDYGQHDSLLYIVMELLQGEDLADVLKSEGRLPPERILHIARQVLKSLAEAHSQNIVHRDLKPENIFLSVMGDDRDHVKVVDFGIAKLLQPTSADAEEPSGRRLTMSGSTVGTPTYMSPEQAAGEDVDGQTDLYALGVIMYEAANGRPPFYNKDPIKVMRAQLFDPVPPLRDPKYHGTLLDRVIHKALQKDRADRFKTASDMLLALAGEPVARPVIQGIALDQIEDPSGDGLQEDTGPNTDDFDPGRRFPNTLSFAQGIANERSTSPDDSVPFGVVDAHADTMAPRRRQTLLSHNTDGSGHLPPPEPRERTPSSSDNAASSILTVIEEEQASDVILLTKKKTPGALDVAGEVVSAPTPSRALPPPPAAARAKSATAQKPPAKKNTSRDSDIYKSWEWEPGIDIESEGQDTLPERDGIGAWIVLLMVVAAIATIAFVL